MSNRLLKWLLIKTINGNNIRKSEEEDKEMLPPQPALLSTPVKKPPTREGEALSSQKTSIQEPKLTCGEVKGGLASKGRLSNEPSDPVVTPSSPPGVSPSSPNDNANLSAVTPLYLHFQANVSLQILL